MKKFLVCLTAISLVIPALAQDSNEDNVRFGLRITPQPTWFKGDKNNIPSGAKFGLGFGLNMEFRISGVAALLTGIGGDFEGGKYTFKSSENYEAKYWLDENNEFVSPNTFEDRTRKSNTAYILKERSIKTTYVTIPVILKLSTKEYSGLKYSGMAGVELGIRAKAITTDTYSEARKYVNDTLYTPYAGEESIADINLSKESALIPLRLGINAGLGAEYRLGGSTSAFISINYFQSLTNQMRKESNYIVSKIDKTSSKPTFVDQKLKLSGIRISLGIMF